MTRLTAVAERPADRATLRRQAMTAIRIFVFSREHVAAGRHEPLPDAESPYCSVCGESFDEARHQRRRPRRRRALRQVDGLAAERAGWR